MGPWALVQGCAGWAWNPTGPQITPFVTRWIAIPPCGTSGPGFCAELQSGARRGDPAPESQLFLSPFWTQNPGSRFRRFSSAMCWPLVAMQTPRCYYSTPSISNAMPANEMSSVLYTGGHQWDQIWCDRPPPAGRGPKGAPWAPRGPLGLLGAPRRPQGAPWGPKRPKGAQRPP